MDLTNDFRVTTPVDRAWEVLTDLELIAPCMPGAQLQEVEGDAYRGIVKVKVGPVQAQYKGEVTFVERDDENHVAVLSAVGRETRGQGNASATITARLTPDGDGTAVSIATDLTITGRVAQFGRGMLEDVSAGLLDQFVSCLESSVLGGTSDGDATDEDTPATPAETPTVRTIDAPEPEPIDLMATAGSPIAKRLIPAGVVLAIILLIIRSLRGSGASHE